MSDATHEKPKTAEHVPSLEELQRARAILVKEVARGSPQAIDLLADYDRRIADLIRKQGGSP